jgi:hypothetical protein
MRASAGRPPWSHTLLALIMVCAPACSHRVQEAQPMLTDWGSIDAGLRSLSWSIGSFPGLTSGLALELAALQLDSLTTLLESANSQSAPNPELEWRLGELYRMAHNLDIPGAWAASESHLETALSLDSTSTMAHLTLGGLYVGTDQTYLRAAEPHFQFVLQHPIDSVAYDFRAEALALGGLFIIYVNRLADSAALATAKLLAVNEQVDSTYRRLAAEYVRDGGIGWRFEFQTAPGPPRQPMR